MKYEIRAISKSEIPVLRDMLYEAIFVPPGAQPPPREVLDAPELQVYIDHFGGKKDDHCLVAVVDENIVGAVWTRIMHDYGHLDDETPSFAIALLPPWRGRGMGTELMRRMLALLRQKGYARASLAVQKKNYAVRMYEKVGFKTVAENDQEYIMLCDLARTCDGQ